MDYVKVVLSYFMLNGIFCLVTSNMCGVTVCRRQQRDSGYISCDTGKILIENVTEADRVADNKWAFLSLRRICTGKSLCDIYQICQDSRNQNLRVYYTCNLLPPTDSLQMCTNDVMVLNQDHGVIVSPRYPDIVTQSCSWKVLVPKTHFVVVTIHDLERAKDNCNGGLQVRASKNCPDSSIPPGLLCKLEEHSIVYRTCGDVDIDLVTNMISGIRFWISYKVLPLYDVSPHVYEAQYSCPLGTETNQEIKRVPIMSPLVPPVIITRRVGVVNTTIHVDNETAVNKIEKKTTESFNTAERMIFYVAITIAFLSLNGLIVVTVICIRRQRRLKANGPIIDHSSIPTTYPSTFNCNRPLPPVQPQHSQLTQSPSLMEGYGIVADDITQSFDQTSETSAYAEVDDTLPCRPDPYRYHEEKPKIPEPVENVYSELSDNDKSGYCEILDTVWHNIPILESDQAKLIKGDKYKSQYSSDSGVRSRPSSFEGPFSHFESKRKSQISDQTDSDESLFGDEQYDYIQSAHV